MLALNISGLHFFHDLDAYHAVALIGLNTIIATPLVASLLRLYHFALITIAFYAISYSIYLIIAGVSYAWYFSVVPNGCVLDSISTPFTVLLIFVALYQIVCSAVYPLYFLEEHPPSTQGHRGRYPGFVVLIFYIAPITGVVFLESLKHSVVLIDDTESVFTFAQVFALAMIVAPAFEVIKYLLSIFWKMSERSTNTVNTKFTNPVVKLCRILYTRCNFQQ